MTDTIVELTDVSRTYNGASGTVALDQVTLAIARGEFTAVMGASGSGKSTLLNVVAGLDRPSSGRILVDGQDLSHATESDLARYRRTRIGFVFQFFNLLPNLSVLDNVMVPAELAGMARDEANTRGRQLLDELGIGTVERSYPTNLSGGQRQRVAIARALINRPALVLADEPTGTLDSHTGEQVMELLDEINKRGQTIMLVTHDVNLATSHGRRILTLSDGAIVDDTTIEARRQAQPADLVRLRAGKA